MTPLQNYIEALNSALTEVEAATQTQILWRPALLSDRWMFPDRRVVHTTPSCLEAKAKEGGAACRHDCDIYADYWNGLKREPLIRNCHAGRQECIVPVWDEDDYAGCFFIGRFNEDSSDKHLRAVAALVLRIYALLQPLRASALPVSCQAEHPAVQLALNRLHADPAPASLRAYLLADEAGISPSRFVHLFKEATGQPFDVVRQRVVMERARRLLAESDSAIGQVAERCGYSNQHYFAAAFKREMGCTPTSFRKQCRERDHA